MSIKNAFDKIKKLFFDSENQEVPKGDTYFLFIGIDDYLNETPLNFCINESELLLNIWLNKPKSRIKNKNVYKLYNSNATKINIIKHLNNLSTNLDSNDQLIIHFSGHGYNKLESEFFIPVDGSYDNIYSCISSLSINSYIKNSNVSNVLFIVNTWKKTLDKEYESIQNQMEILIKKELNKPLDKEQSIYEDLINFLKTDSKQRSKEIFWFSKKPMSKTTETDSVFGEWRINDEKLKNEINSNRSKIKRHIYQGKLDEALSQMSVIVENNDVEIDSQVKTLQYQLNKIKNLNKNREAVEVEEKKISSLTTGLVNQISEKGFYVINLPENNRDSKMKKNRTVILFTCADPSDQSRLRLNDEYRDIEYELMRAKNRDEYELIPCLASRIGDFQRKLLDIRPQIIHFSGHGENEGICLIGDDNGNTNMVENEPLAELFRLFANDIKCIFLNSCYSIHQSKLLNQYIDHVICMNNSVNDKTAIHFASSFYAALSSGQNIEFSFEFAKNSISLHKLEGSDIPQLLLRKN